MQTNIMQETDIVLVGGGIMSATLGLMLKEFNPNFTVQVFERLNDAAEESSSEWNNAGTGHSAFCELNYTPMKNGVVDTKKALTICEKFEESRQFWSYLVRKNIVSNPKDFIHSVPHMSFVLGEDNCNFLKKRYEAMSKEPLFADMEYSENPEQIKQWAPLLMSGRTTKERLAATYIKWGTDVNFGRLTKKMLAHQCNQDGVNVAFNTEVVDLKQQADGRWKVFYKNRTTGEKSSILTKFVFMGAGGYALLLLQKSGIPEGKGYGGFPVSGQWLVCNNPEVVAQHDTKVYGKASVGAPPMSVPHLDTRYIDGKKSLLFGPFAGFSTKYLKNGSYMDLFRSIELSNIKPMLQAGMANMPLTKYLIKEVLKSHSSKVEFLRNYMEDAKDSDWEIKIAGQRVQVIKEVNGKGVLEFGTEVISSADGSCAALLGASPGASTATSIMIQLIKTCFPKEFQSQEWQEKLKEMVPSYGMKLNDSQEKLNELRKETSTTLQLSV